uniref:Uncharacterized protein n=1 Tax=Caenorhabditis tropicalis TaxID=1561998 RepID=A0A1I7T4C5_9PELO
MPGSVDLPVNQLTFPTWIVTTSKIYLVSKAHRPIQAEAVAETLPTGCTVHIAENNVPLLHITVRYNPFHDRNQDNSSRTTAIKFRVRRLLEGTESEVSVKVVFESQVVEVYVFV